METLFMAFEMRCHTNGVHLRNLQLTPEPPFRGDRQTPDHVKKCFNLPLRANAGLKLVCLSNVKIGKMKLV